MARTGPMREAPIATERCRHDRIGQDQAVTAFGEIESARPAEALGLYSGNANQALARKIGSYLGTALGQSEVFEFANENIFVRIIDNVREKDIFLMQPTCKPVQKSIMELLIMIDAFKRASAGRITAVVPYYSYGRSDKKDQPRVPITARLIADMISVAGADRVEQAIQEGNHQDHQHHGYHQRGHQLHAHPPAGRQADRIGVDTLCPHRGVVHPGNGDAHDQRGDTLLQIKKGEAG